MVCPGVVSFVIVCSRLARNTLSARTISIRASSARSRRCIRSVGQVDKSFCLPPLRTLRQRITVRPSPLVQVLQGGVAPGDWQVALLASHRRRLRGCGAGSCQGRSYRRLIPEGRHHEAGGATRRLLLYANLAPEPFARKKPVIPSWSPLNQFGTSGVESTLGKVGRRI
jgi:hypothetical protein